MMRQFCVLLRLYKIIISLLLCCRKIYVTYISYITLNGEMILKNMEQSSLCRLQLLSLTHSFLSH